MTNLKFVAVLKVGGFQELLADDFYDGIFELFLEGDVLATSVQLIQQLLTPTRAFYRLFYTVN